MLCPITGGNWRPFNLAMIARGPDVVDAYVPIRTGGRVCLVSVDDVSEQRLGSVRWLAQHHRCGAYYRAKTAARESVDSLGEALAEVLGVDLSNPTA